MWSSMKEVLRLPESKIFLQPTFSSPRDLRSLVAALRLWEPGIPQVFSTKASVFTKGSKGSRIQIVQNDNPNMTDQNTLQKSPGSFHSLDHLDPNKDSPRTSVNFGCDFFQNITGCLKHL